MNPSPLFSRCISFFGLAIVALLLISLTPTNAQQQQQYRVAQPIPQAAPDVSVGWASDEMADGGSGSSDASYLQQHQAWASQQVEQLEQQRVAQLAQAQARFDHQQRLDAYLQTQSAQQQPQRVQLLHSDGSSITTVASEMRRRRPPVEEEPLEEEPRRRKPKRQPEEDEPRTPRDEPKEEPSRPRREPKEEPSRPRREPASDQPDWRRQCAERCDERSMEVTGVGVHVVPSDKAEVKATIEFRRLVNTTKSGGELPLEEMRSLISEVQTEVSSKAAAVVAFLTNGTMARYISKLRTSSMGLEPLYEYQTGRQQLMGYRASNSITFRVEVEHAGAVIDSIVEIGVSRIDGVSFVASPKILNAARHVAIQNAVEDAISQAMSALSGLSDLSSYDRRDLQIIRMDIVGVTRPEATNSLSSMSSPMAPQAMMSKSFRAEGAAMDMAYSPVEGEEKTVGATVSMKIRF